MIFEPKWRSLMANTTMPIFTPEQCQNIRTQQRQIFEKMTRIENQLDAKDVID